MLGLLPLTLICASHIPGESAPLQLAKAATYIEISTRVVTLAMDITYVARALKLSEILRFQPASNCEYGGAHAGSPRQCHRGKRLPAPRGKPSTHKPLLTSRGPLDKLALAVPEASKRFRQSQLNGREFA